MPKRLKEGFFFVFYAFNGSQYAFNPAPARGRLYIAAAISSNYIAAALHPLLPCRPRFRRRPSPPPTPTELVVAPSNRRRAASSRPRPAGGATAPPRPPPAEPPPPPGRRYPRPPPLGPVAIGAPATRNLKAAAALPPPRPPATSPAAAPPTYHLFPPPPPVLARWLHRLLPCSEEEDEQGIALLMGWNPHHTQPHPKLTYLDTQPYPAQLVNFSTLTNPPHYKRVTHKNSWILLYIGI